MQCRRPTDSFTNGIILSLSQLWAANEKMTHPGTRANISKATSVQALDKVGIEGLSYSIQKYISHPFLIGVPGHIDPRLDSIPYFSLFLALLTGCLLT